MFKQDWMERQIDAIAKSFAAVLFGKERLKSVMLDYEEQEEVSTDLEEEMIKRVIKKHIDEKNYTAAEEMIFELLKLNNSPQNLEIALSFYNELHDLNHDDLKSYGFSEESIRDGIERLKQFYS